jgi:putative nucleotidyltransferase with HDIG domain
MPEEKHKVDVPRLIREVARTKEIVIKVCIIAAAVVLLALMFPRGESMEPEYKVGAVWAQRDLIAPFSFPIFRDALEYSRDVEEAKKKVYDVFERDTAATDRQLAQLQAFFVQLRGAVKARIETKRAERSHSSDAAADSSAFNALASALAIPFSEREWEVLRSLAASNRLTEIEKVLASILEEYHRTGILDRDKRTLGRSDIALRRGTMEEIIPSERLYDHSDIVSLLEHDLAKRFASDGNAVGIAYKIGIMYIGPDIAFNQSATDQAMNVAIDAVPRTNGIVQENERIVSKHERITPDIRLKLESLRRTKADRGPASDTPSQFLGTLIHVMIVCVPYGIYLTLFRKRISGNNRRLALVASVILLVAVVAYATREVDVNAPLEYLIVVPVGSMLLTIIFDSRVGFYGTVTLAFLVAGIRGNDYALALSTLIAGALSVYTVRDMKNRTQIFRSLGFIFLGYALAIGCLGLERYESVRVVAEQMTYALGNAVISPVLTYGLLIFLEKVFRVTTDLTLMELAHFNHPLLRLLAEKAPGTYHHSMTMATLAETGAAAVGANEVLARVAAYYHDIGKVVKPTYFVENQKGSRSRHDKLSPRMSSLIIAAHVKEGMALAREYGLPEEIVDFIPMHHGTTRIDYFYNKALQMAESSGDETKIDEINEGDYRYPGPRPQTKETGIMMLADAVEAAVRTIEDPTPQRLEDAIDELFRRRFEEGELSECPLTLKDLSRIKTAFLSVLVGIYHTRVKYPATERKKPRTNRSQPPPAAGPAEPPAGANPPGPVKEIETE